MLRTDREAENGRGRIVEAGGVLACGVRTFFSLRKTHLPCPWTLPVTGRGAIQTLALCTSAPPLTASLLEATHSMSRPACDAIIKPVPLRSMIAKKTPDVRSSTPAKEEQRPVRPGQRLACRSVLIQGRMRSMHQHTEPHTSIRLRNLGEWRKSAGWILSRDGARHKAHSSGGGKKWRRCPSGRACVETR